MLDALKLKTQLAANAAADPADVLAAKTALKNLGLYEPPEWGVTDIPDRALFDAIKAFQKGAQLRVDGVMKPGGETETNLKTAAELVRRHGRHGDTVLAHITPAEAELLHRVTDGGSVNPDTGLPEFFIGSALGSIASSFMGNALGSTVGNIAGQAIGSYAANKIGKKIGGPFGEILGNTVGGYLGSGSHTDIAGGLSNSFGNAVGGYASRKIGGPFGDTIGNALGNTVGSTVGNMANNGLDALDSMGDANTDLGGIDHVAPVGNVSNTSIAADQNDALRTPRFNPGSSTSISAPAQPRTPQRNLLGLPMEAKTPSQSSWSRPPEQPKAQPRPQTPLEKIEQQTDELMRPKSLEENLAALKKNPIKPLAQAAQTRISDDMRQRVKQAQAATRSQDANRTMEMRPQSRNLPGVSVESVSGNAREIQALAKSTDHTQFAKYQADALNTGGNQALAEYGNLIEQAHAKDPKLAQSINQSVKQRLGHDPLQDLDLGPNPFERQSMIGEGVQVAENGAGAFGYFDKKKMEAFTEAQKGILSGSNVSKEPDFGTWRDEREALYSGVTGSMDGFIERYEKEMAIDPKTRDKLPPELRNYYDAYKQHEAKAYGNDPVDRKRNAHLAGVRAAGDVEKPGPKPTPMDHLAKRYEAKLSEKAKADPSVKEGMLRALTYRQQTKQEQYKTMGKLRELEKTYPDEFGPKGLIGNMSVSVSDPRKEPWSLEPEEIDQALDDNRQALEVLSWLGAGEGEMNKAFRIKTHLGTFMDLAGVTESFQKSIKRLEDEKNHRSRNKP